MNSIIEETVVFFGLFFLKLTLMLMDFLPKFGWLKVGVAGNALIQFFHFSDIPSLFLWSYPVSPSGAWRWVTLLQLIYEFTDRYVLTCRSHVTLDQWIWLTDIYSKSSFWERAEWYISMNFYMISQVALVVKNPPADAGNIRDTGLIPGSGRSPEGGHGNPLQYSCLENPHRQRRLAGYSPWGRTELDMTEVT